MQFLPIIFTLIYCVVAEEVVASESNIETEWNQWKQKFGKYYKSKTDEYRHWKVWMANYKYVKEFNATDACFTVELNFLADQIVQRTPYQYKHADTIALIGGDYGSIPDSWDWRDKNVISEVKDVSQSLFTQSVVAAECVESYGAITKGTLLAVSEYEVHDCCSKQDVFVEDIFECIYDSGGLCSDTDYPKSAGRCMNSSCQAVVKINGGRIVVSGDENAMKAAVYKMPVMVLIDASHPSFQLYRSGVYRDIRCSTTLLDHSLQVVGYGHSNSDDYWICKNNWGKSWGNDGYINIARNKGNLCGIATHATYLV